MEIKIINRQEVLGKDFRVYGDFDNPLFLAKDVAEWIDYSKTGNGTYDVSNMLRNVDNDEKLLRTIFVKGQNRKTWFVTEDGLYEILMQSRKPIAKLFKKKVKAILKELRTGRYRLPQNYQEALQALLESLKDNDELLMENEYLSRTKSWISDRKTATAMNTASQKSKEVKRLKIELDRSCEYATVRRVENYYHRKIDWFPLKEFCKANGYKIKYVFDEIYGKINSYPNVAWYSVYEIDLRDFCDDDGDEKC